MMEKYWSSLGGITLCGIPIFEAFFCLLYVSVFCVVFGVLYQRNRTFLFSFLNPTQVAPNGFAPGLGDG